MKTKFVQGAAFVWFMLIIFIIMFAFIYSILMRPVGDIYNMFYNDSALQDQVYQDFFIRSKTLWYWFPMLAIIVFIIWAFLKIQEGDGYVPNA